MHLPVLYELSLLSRNLRRTHSGFCDDVTADGCLPPCVPQPPLSLIAEMDSQLLIATVLRLCERIVNGCARLSKPYLRKTMLFGRDRAPCYNFTPKLYRIFRRCRKTKYSLFNSSRLLISFLLIISLLIIFTEYKDCTNFPTQISLFLSFYEEVRYYLKNLPVSNIEKFIRGNEFERIHQSYILDFATRTRMGRNIR